MTAAVEDLRSTGLPRRVFGAEHERWRARVRAFFEDEVVPDYPSWERDGRPPRWFWRRAGELGLLGVGVPERFGGTPGSTFLHSAVTTEEAQRAGLALGGLRVHTDICMPYFLEHADDDQRERWLPRLCRGEAVAALALSEPGAGSDLKALATRATRDGDHYVLEGAKTFISNGGSADLVIVAAKTDPSAGRQGISLFVVEASAPGFVRGAPLDKLGQKAQDLAELFLDGVRVPTADRLGEEGRGFEFLTSNLAQERVSIALNAQAAARTTLEHAVACLASGKARAGQHAKFELAACAVDVEAGQALADRALEALVAGELQPADAAGVKLFCTELQGRVADRCVQVLGPVALERRSRLGRAFADARVGRIYGGSSEIMKVIVAQDLGL